MIDASAGQHTCLVIFGKVTRVDDPLYSIYQDRIHKVVNIANLDKTLIRWSKLGRIIDRTIALS